MHATNIHTYREILTDGAKCYSGVMRIVQTAKITLTFCQCCYGKIYHGTVFASHALSPPIKASLLHTI